MVFTVKLCFLMDCTASMQPWLKKAAQHMKEIITTLELQYCTAIFTVAFVGYRDYGDSEQFLIHNFDTSDRIEHFIQGIVAKGGSDDAEDVAWGLDKLRTAIDWKRPDIGIVYHIADAPAHGLDYHDDRVDDRFPNGDPDGLDPLEPLMWLSNNHINYTFVRITRQTDRMIDVFEEYYTPERFHVIDLASRGPNGLHDTIVENLSSTITQHISSRDREEDSCSPTHISCYDR